MKGKRVTITIILVLLILCITDIIYMTSFKLNAFNSKFYSKEFSKYGVYGEFPDKDIDKINSGLLLYLKGKKDDYDTGLFNQEGVDHLKDVKVLIQKLDIYYYLLLIVSVLLVVGLFLLGKDDFLKNLTRVLFFGGLLTLFTVIVLLVLVKFNFSGVFTVFHQIFFPQGNWLFSSSANIIKLYPSGFFYDMARKVFFSIVLYGNILILAGVLIFFSKK